MSVEGSEPDAKPTKRKPERPFDFANYPSRRIVLRLAYHGHLYDGLAKQDKTSNTVEAFVVDALRRVRLVPHDGPADLSRCGRTDKGVSALGNAFSFTARASSWPGDDPQKPPLDYCLMLNNVLPPTIRIIGWAYAGEGFDARFSCVGRTYRYYFCHRGLDLDAMRTAAAQLEGVHNFRNFCKMDVVNVSNYERHVHSVRIVPSEMLPEVISYLEIYANSFLYHQIRCTMEVLLLVGRGLEEPNIVSVLLLRGDRKPVYPLADGTPLVLWNCHFDTLEWNISHRAFVAAEQELQDIATALLIRAAVSESMRAQLFTWYEGHTDFDNRRVAERTRASPHVNQWSATGSDWTDARTHGNLRVRKYDLYTMAKQQQEPKRKNESDESKEQRKNGAEVPAGGRPYVKLLDRETERTFEEEVEALSDRKRARHEANMEKKKRERRY